MYLLRQALSICKICNAQHPNGNFTSIEAAIRHAHHNSELPPCFLQQQQQDLLQVETHAQEKGGGGGGGGRGKGEGEGEGGEKKASFGG